MTEEASIVDITANAAYERQLYRCLAPMPFRRSRRRREYLEAAIPKGFRKKLLIVKGQVVGQIEYAPAEASGYPITGDNVIVMNCIWVLRRAKGHKFGKQLLENMVKGEQDVRGFATVALKNHWSPWLRKEQMEKLGFKTVDSVEVRHKLKNTEKRFTILLMWLPAIARSKPPQWNKNTLLRGTRFCTAHPLHHPQAAKTEEILQETTPHEAKAANGIEVFSIKDKSHQRFNIHDTLCKNTLS